MSAPAKWAPGDACYILTTLWVFSDGSTAIAMGDIEPHRPVITTRREIEKCVVDRPSTYEDRVIVKDRHGGLDILESDLYRTREAAAEADRLKDKEDGMSIEAGVVVGLDGEPLYWHLPPGRDGAALPDSRDLWEVFWEHRAVLRGFAHSHPGDGVPGPSYTDVTTFAAVEAGLGKRLEWYIISANRLVVIRWTGPDRLSYRGEEWLGPAPWLGQLRMISGYDNGRTKGE